jgi:hypothetical protein
VHIEKAIIRVMNFMSDLRPGDYQFVSLCHLLLVLQISDFRVAGQLEGSIFLGNVG